MTQNWRRPLVAVVASVAVLVPAGLAVQSAQAATLPTIVINEVESNGGTPGDWIELKNIGHTAVDVSNWYVMDNKAETLQIPASTSIPAGGYYTVDTDLTPDAPYFGLGSADSARIFESDGTTLVDSYSWTAHATVTYARNPDGIGNFAQSSASSKNAENTPADFSASAATGTLVTTGALTTWPGGTAVTAVDPAGFVASNLSGLDYETGSPDSLWAIDNGPGTLYKLVKSGSGWVPASGDWATGKTIHYKTGTNNVDAEGLTYAAGGSAAGIYVSSERNNDDSGVSRPGVEKYLPNTAGTSLNAVRDWNLTADLPTTGANLGLEAITWIPDGALVAEGFIDDSTGLAYKPSDYPDNGGGLFFVGLEGNGTIYAYDLDQNADTFKRVASFSSGAPSIMDLQWDADTNKLWTDCDGSAPCNNVGHNATLEIAQSGDDDGHFVVTADYSNPTGLPLSNNEGFAIAPNTLCVDNAKPVFWSDDNALNTHSVREGTINCPTLADAPSTSTPTPTPTPSTTTTQPPVTPTVTGSATIAGKPLVGETLSATVTSVNPATATFGYQWLRNGAVIAGATGSSYNTIKADAGKKISVQIAAAASGFVSASLISAPTAVIQQQFALTTSPKITGTVKVGKTVKVSVGTWAPRPTFTYRWYANGKAIAKATHSTYTITKSVKAKKLTVKVTATKANHLGVAKTSKATAKVK